MGMIDFDSERPRPAGRGRRVRRSDLEPIRDRLATLGRPHTPADVADAMRAEGLVVSDSSVIETVESLRRNSIGAGQLDGLLRLPGVTDVLVNGPDQVFVDRGAGLELTDVRFGSDAEVRRLAQRLAASVGRRLDDSSPFVDARLADGCRVHAVLDAVAAPGTCISLRVPATRTFSLDDCVRTGLHDRGCRTVAEAPGRCPAGLLGQRRDGVGEDDAARRPACPGAAGRADRRGGGFPRIGTRSSTRPADGGPAGQCRTRRGDQPDRSRAAVVADAAGPTRRR